MELMAIAPQQAPLPMERRFRARARWGLIHDDFLRRSDAYNFFARLGDAVVTGPTGNNLRDLRIFLAR